MGYPGGPKIDAAAKKGNPNAVKFPRVFLEEDSYDFSFSGLKSAVLNYVNKQKMMGEPIVPEDIAASRLWWKCWWKKPSMRRRKEA